MSVDSLLEPGIASLALLDNLAPSALRDMAASARIRALPKGTRVFDQGEATDRAHALLAGTVRISQTGSDGNEVLVRFIGPGEIFGSVAIYTNQRYPADATAMVDSIGVSWSQDDLLELMERHSRVAINMVSIVGQRLAEMQDRVREMATHRTERRIAHALLRLLRQAGRPVTGGTEIAFPLRRKDIADISGTTLYTASRILTDWERSGLLSTRNRRLTLHSIESIQQIAENGGG